MKNSISCRHLIAVAGILLIASCGYRGPLYLPDEAPENAEQQQPVNEQEIPETIDQEQH